MEPRRNPAHRFRETVLPPELRISLVSFRLRKVQLGFTDHTAAAWMRRYCETVLC